MIHGKKLAAFAAAAALLVPVLALGVMSRPDPGVSPDWRGNSAQAQGGQGNLANPNLSQGAFGEGTFEFKGTITGVNSAARTFAVNGLWVNPQRWIDMASAMNFRVQGVDLNAARTQMMNLQAGDRVMVRGEIVSGGVRITHLDLQKGSGSASNPNQGQQGNQGGQGNEQGSGGSAALREQIQMRLSELIRQVNELLARVLSRNQAGSGGTATSTPTSTVPGGSTSTPTSTPTSTTP